MITFSKLGSFGRLGNQLFQISATVALANRNRDVAKFNEWSYSSYFKNPINAGLDESEIKNNYRERSFEYHPIEYKNGLDLIGYFQSERYFKDSEELIRYYFDFKDELIDDEKIEIAKKSCSIHIRRTDYLNFPEYHPFPGIDYYEKAIKLMRDMGISDFIIFSDDIEWCKKNFGSFFKYSEGLSDIQDLALMSKCKNHIIANSSFSWWGAWLNNNKDKKVIAPSLWFGPAKKNVITNDLYCSDWIKI